MYIASFYVEAGFIYAGGAYVACRFLSTLPVPTVRASNQLYSEFMDELQKLSLVALTAITGVGRGTLFRILQAQIKHKFSWQEFWVLSSTKLKLIGLHEKLIDRLLAFKKEHTIYSYHEYLFIRKIKTLVLSDDNYPPLLKHCSFAPYVLFTKGKPMQWYQQPVAAVVGTRHSTAYGELATKKITQELSSLGAVIVSGGMYGVDAQAHTSALEVEGQSAAVLGYGFEHCYPASFSGQLEKWLRKGITLLSPFAPHVAPSKGTFPARNQIVAGMSHAVVVTEAGQQSGSHITARYAAEEGRVVCAVPGPITNPYSEGTKVLINDGAVLVSSGKEVLSEVRSCFKECLGASSQALQVLSLLKKEPADSNQLALKLEMTLQQLQPLLSELELLSAVTQEAGRWQIAHY